MLKQFLVVALAVFALGATVAGCGDDNGDSASAGDAASAGDSQSASDQSASAESPTKAKFLKEASDMCIREREKLSGKAIAYGKRAAKEDPDVLEAEYFPGLVTQVALPSIQSQLDQLRELGMPEGDEEELEEIYTALQKAINEAKANPPKGSNQFLAAFRQHRNLASEYGLVNCVYP